jgi:hypothetical protein
MKIPRIDQEFRGLMPQLRADEYALLEASILRDGCLDSLKVWRGILLDGHTRLPQKAATPIPIPVPKCSNISHIP